jgi:hypothetical protein
MDTSSPNRLLLHRRHPNPSRPEATCRGISRRNPPLRRRSRTMASPARHIARHPRLCPAIGPSRTPLPRPRRLQEGTTPRMSCTSRSNSNLSRLRIRGNNLHPRRRLPATRTRLRTRIRRTMRHTGLNSPMFLRTRLRRRQRPTPPRLHKATTASPRHRLMLPHTGTR